MSIKRLDCFTIICDWPGCGADALEGSDYSGWGDVDYVIEEATDADWRVGRDRKQHYCPEHPTTWASDPEQVASMIAPYLLIHDGDTDNPDDDGKVSLVKAITETLLDQGNLPIPGTAVTS